jgi:type I restriction enzyme M protein
LLKQWKKYRDSNFKNPPGVETGTLLGPENGEPRCWWADVKFIAENDYNLAAGRYKPQVAEKAPEENPVQLINEVLHIEREIADGLEKLLKNLEV